MKRYLPFIIVALVGLLAVGGGAFLYRAKRSANPTPKISKTETLPSGESIHALGPADAAVTLEEFGDFQCPPCGMRAEPINQLQKHSHLRVIYPEFPRSNHAHARQQTLAADTSGGR